jgi:hypothetical protein
VITDTGASSAIVDSNVHNEDRDVNESEVSTAHVTGQGREQAVPGTMATTSEAPKAVSFPSFSCL